MLDYSSEEEIIDVEAPDSPSIDLESASDDSLTELPFYRVLFFDETQLYFSSTPNSSPIKFRVHVPLMPPTPEELVLQTTCKNQHQLLQTHLQKDVSSSTIRTSTLAIEKYAKALDDLEKKTLSRIGRIAEDNVRDTENTAWFTFYQEHTGNLTSHQGTLDVQTGNVQSTSVQTLQTKQHQYNQRVSQIQDQVANVLAELNTLDESKPLSKQQYSVFTKTLEEARNSLADAGPMELLTSEIIKLDPANAPTFANQWFTKQSSLIKNLSAAEMRLSRQNIPDTSMLSPNQSFDLQSNQGGAASGSSKSNLYKLYGKQEIPSFDKEYHKYPSWRQEWHSCIMPGQDEAWLLRMLDQKTPKSDDISIYQTMKEAWAYLDEVYANPLSVSAHLMTGFMSDKPIPGANDDQKLINLHTQVMKLLNDLKAVGEEHQLTKNTFAIQHLIKKLPDQAGVELGTIRRRKERENAASGVELTSEQRSEALWDTVKQYLNDQKSDIIAFRPWKLDQKPTKAKINAVNDQKPSSKKPAASEASHDTGRLSTDSAIKAKQLEFGKCKSCNGYHVWHTQRKQVRPSDRLNDCKKFRGLAVDDRVDFVTKNDCCAKCLSWRHLRDNCPHDNMRCTFKDQNGVQCGGPHHRLLHGSSKTAIINSMSTETVLHKDVAISPSLLCLVDSVVHNVRTTVILDGGSTVSCITNEFADQLGLQGTWTRRWVETAGRPPELKDIKEYVLKWKVAGGTRVISLLGLDRITSAPEEVDVSIAYDIFPHVPKNALARPTREVGLLIGQDQGDLQPGGGLERDQCGKLRAMRIPFSTGWVLCGSHPEIHHKGLQYSVSMLQYRDMVPSAPPLASINRLAISSRPPVDTCLAFKDKDFLECEEMGVDTPRKCHKCTSCQNCTITHEGRTVHEQLELQLMRENIWLDRDAKQLTVSYPVIGDISQLKDNRFQAVQRATSLWRSLKNKGLLTKYQEQVDDYVGRGVWQRTSIEDIENWQKSGGAIHYVAHHCVFNSHSVSTPLRVVVDSAIKNCYTGPSINQLYCKGPAALNNMFQVLTKWRSFECALIFDVKKAYHCIKTTPKEFYTRLVVWRESEDHDWTTYGHCCMGMGDLCSSTFLELGMEIAAREGVHIDARAAQQILEQRYVDDACGGGSRDEVMRMRGSWRSDENGKLSFDGTISQILANVGFQPKMIVCSGDKEPELLSKVDKVLGMKWDPEHDLIEFKLVLTLHKKQGAGKTGPDLAPDDIPMIATFQFTKRVALQLSAQLYDPLGLLTAYLVNFKLAMRDITIHQIDWDQELPHAMQERWRKLVIDVIAADPVVFQRSLRSDDVVGHPEIVAYFDGSDQAFAAVVYLRWMTTEPGVWHTCLIASKARVCPKAGQTTPRAELSGLVLLTRLVNNIVKSLDVSPCRITVIGDSTCTISSCEMNAASLNPYFANRVIEIIHSMQSWGKPSPIAATEELDDADVMTDAEPVVDQLYHTAGDINIADIPSRGTANLQDIGPGSEWQLGPPYLKFSRENWPINRDFIHGVPDEEKRTKFWRVLVLNEVANGHDRLWRIMEYSDNILKVRGIYARLIAATISQDKETIAKPPSVVHFKLADQLMDWLTMRDTVETLAKHSYESLALFWSGGICYTQGRAGQQGMQLLVGQPKLKVIPAKSRLAHLLLVKAHQEDHRQNDSDALWRTRGYGYWIIQGGKTAKKVVKSCQLCKVLKPTLTQQQIGNLPEVKFKVPCFPFTHISLDYLGPVWVYDDVKQRVKKKAYPIVICCLNTGAIHTLLATGYSTPRFLSQFNFYRSFRGSPQYVYTDMGSQLTCVAKQFSDADAPNPNWQDIQEQTAADGIVWRHAPSGCQWRDGTSEACVKMIKKTIRHLSKGGLHTYEDYQGLLGRVANAINQRPVGVKHHNHGEPGVVAITPNLLLQCSRTADAQIDPSIVTTQSHHSAYDKLRYVEESLADWWKVWFRDVADSLVPLRGWKSAHENIKVGDICLLKTEAKMGPGTYRLCRVLETKPDEKGLVRTVVIGYRPRNAKDYALPYNSKQLYTQDMAVQRLAVVATAEEAAQTSPNSVDALNCLFAW